MGLLDIDGLIEFIATNLLLFLASDNYLQTILQYYKKTHIRILLGTGRWKTLSNRGSVFPAEGWSSPMQNLLKSGHD